MIIVIALTEDIKFKEEGVKNFFAHPMKLGKTNGVIFFMGAFGVVSKIGNPNVFFL